MSVRRIETRTADDPDEHRGLPEIELGDVATEEELGGASEPMDRRPSVLPEVDVVDVRSEQPVLLVATLERDRDRQLPDLSKDGALGGQEERAGELLR